MGRFALCLALIACSCNGKSPPATSAPAGDMTAANQPESGPAADPPSSRAGAPGPSDHAGGSEGPPVRELAVYSEPWDPGKPVELEALATRRMFVTAKSSAICPTREQAEARKCGNSEEFAEQGLALRRGADVLVVGDAPFDGHWRAIRFQVSGTLPAWIRADDVAERPLLDALDDFAKRPDVAGATAIDGMKADAIHKLEPGTLVTFQHKKGVEFAQHGRANAFDKEGGIMLYVPTRRYPVAVQLVEPEDDPRFMARHGCLFNGDCLTLDYVCDKKAYCDEISILARTTAIRVAPPDDEEGEWPATWKRYHMPLLVGVAVADRFGTFEFQEPGWTGKR